MAYTIKWDKPVRIYLKKIDSHISRRIIKKTRQLEKDPFSNDVKSLKGQKGFRLRVGDYRVIFRIEKDEIHVVKVGHRRNIY